MARLAERNFHQDFKAVSAPLDAVMVLGDNRDNSSDSHFIGFIPERGITGKAIDVVLSHDPLRRFDLGFDRWLIPMHMWRLRPLYTSGCEASSSAHGDEAEA